MGKFIDLTGMKFGRLTVLRKTDKRNKNGNFLWEAKCECGNIIYVTSNHISKGYVKSCGCLNLEKIISRNLKHGYRKTALYNSWRNMKKRCYKTNCAQYKDYGGRGISICDEWDDFINFKDWALSNGYCENLTIDRRDNDKNYSPTNCRWVTMKIQNNNKRDNHYLTYNNEIKTLSEWSEKYGINYGTLKERISVLKWPIEKALITPVKSKQKLLIL